MAWFCAAHSHCRLGPRRWPVIRHASPAMRFARGWVRAPAASQPSRRCCRCGEHGEDPAASRPTDRAWTLLFG